MNHQTRVFGWLSLSLLLIAGLAGSGRSQVDSPAPEESLAGRYSPVAPARAIRAAMATNLDIAREWLAADDFASTAETADGLTLLAQLYHHRTERPRWREETAELVTAAQQIGMAAKASNAKSTRDAIERFARLLADAAAPTDDTKGDQNPVRDFKPTAGTRTFMKLMDGLYADAKGAKNAADLENLAYTIAEGANAVALLRREPAWEQAAAQVRDAALAITAKSRGDLQLARSELKNVYQRCEACHQQYKR